MSQAACRMSFASVAVVGAALALVSFATRAEMVYKSVAADGSVTYSSHPLPDAKQVTPIDIRTLSPEERRAADRVRKETEATLSKDFTDREDAWRKADAEIRNATEELKAAEAALESGREPAENEWIGNAGGRGTRLTEGYFARLKGLEDQVAQAKAKLDRAFAARDALD